jgi:hypothetical protein
MVKLQYIANSPISGQRNWRSRFETTVTHTAPPFSRIGLYGLFFWAETVFSPIPSHLPLVLRSPRVIIAIGCTAAAAAGITSYVLTRRKPTAEEIEQQRRDLLATSGRITDGTIMDTLVTEVRGASSSEVDEPENGVPTPHIIVYAYRIAGVTYECSQDVTSLAEHVQGVRTDLPIQVRYAPHNPGNSIVVAESWSGLRLRNP